jgi:hypothetical protein
MNLGGQRGGRHFDETVTNPLPGKTRMLNRCKASGLRQQATLPKFP